MALSTRAHERKAVVDELTQHFEPLVCDKENCEEPKHPNEELALFEKIADRLFKTVYELIQQRDMWLLLYQPRPGLPMAMTGWFSSQKEAEKAATSIVEGAAQALKVIPYQSLLEALRDEEEDFRATFAEEPCADCSLPAWAHGAWRLDKGKLVRATPPASNRAGIGGKCREWKSSSMSDTPSP